MIEVIQALTIILMSTWTAMLIVIAWSLKKIADK